jgi:hypothetical protein
MWHLEKIEKMFCLLIKTSLFIFDMNTLPYDVLGIVASLLPTPKDFSSFSLVNKKTRTATQTPYVLLEAKNRFAKRVYGECEKNFKTVLPNGTKHGEDNKYYASGQLESKCFWKDGKEEGEMRRGGTKMVISGASVLGRTEKLEREDDVVVRKWSTL